MLSKKSSDVFDLAIIGAGPAGISSALQAKKEGLSFIIFEKSKIGGQVNIANSIENFAGIEKPISGSSLCKIFEKQLKNLNIKINFSEVLSVKRMRSIFKITTSKKTSFFAKSIVIATGLAPKKLGLKNEDKLINKRLFYYADPLKFKNFGKHFLILGSGDSAFDQALSFYKLGKTVSIAMKHDLPRCNKSLMQKIFTTKIKILPEYIINSVDKTNNSLFCSFKNKKTLTFDIIISCTGKQKFFPFLGKKPVDNNIKNLYFAGDCTGSPNRYISNACADGICAIRKIVHERSI